MRQWMARWWLAGVVAVAGVWGVSAAALAAPGPDEESVMIGEGDPDEIEPDESPPPRGTPLTTAELAAFERVMALHEQMLTTLEKHRASAPAATKALDALANAKRKVIEVDGRTLAAIKKRVVEEDDVAASLSIPDALLTRIDKSAERWLALEPAIERLLAHEPFGVALMRFTIPLL